MNRKHNKIRQELAEELAQYYLYHLRSELKKNDELIHLPTLEGRPFVETVHENIAIIQKEFPNLKEKKTRINLFKEWWKFTIRKFDVYQNPKSYEETTFKSQNRIFLFKILDIKYRSAEIRNQFSIEMDETIHRMRKAGKQISFEMIYVGETNMFPILEKIVRHSDLDSDICRKILYEQNSYIQSIAYKVIDHEIRETLKKTDEILKSILPAPIAEEVKIHGKVSPKTHKSVSILFCDLSGFTEISGKLTPELLLEELDECFSHFDKITGMHELEKIKTIGDSYMAAGGLNPTNLKLHAVNSVLCALRIQEFMRKYYLSQNRKNLPAWKIRIGIHTGPVVAGILGAQRFNYDIWGDAVNIAQRMESNGVPGKVNISRATYDLTKDFFEFEPRGKIQVKGKGELEMFFVKGIKPELSLNKFGRTPNRSFRKIYENFTSSKIDRHEDFLKESETLEI
ncbi:MAG: adenylate/guanylate cyclase domain-containing protein [Leptospiraceae bacterium]|nr:adenylate/guanylate cyclase domain-containing protein [Leptospiraceae bacterium]MCP5511540.1 adenylate/guanylate cyclase domain-containing protein [Leptospiraceae bacterium]